MSKIISIATGVPQYKHQQDAIFEFADTIYSESETDSRKLKFLYRHSGIDTRYSVLPDYSSNAEDRQFYSKSKSLEPFPDLEKRMQWFACNAAKLSVETIRDCIADKIEPAEITHLITVSCTGMSAPGMDLDIMETLGLSPNIFRTSVNFMGCYAAIHALKIADALCNGDEKANIIIVCTELCTLHFQKENSIDNITSTLLFADGCAAVLMQHNAASAGGMTLKNFFSDVAFKGKKDMSWQLSSRGFLMTLTGYVPDLVKEDFDSLLNKALLNAGMDKESISHWCIHPGGKKILEAIQQSTGLKEEQLQFSYDVLREYGNMSSPTVLFVLEKILRELKEGTAIKDAAVFGAAFGPGLTMETFIATYD
ncbi:MAG: type polyketide synthase [Ferruginibacter sp.]|uniref:type III polyketide synthase n=1 Tax=Ferruginibacter sp. TaxID=1940288 RepID=UPI00265A8578|nr:type III polyketide synthase [Ferruginibacter sp.]MDB5277582.1 type polyketide synthase [Ferruginibacter sp.]